MINNDLFPEPKNILWRVSELNKNVRTILEQAFPLLWISGEISNLKRYPSGHWYFLLKDNDAQVRCVMFRHRNLYLDWVPQNGMKVEVQALVTLYETRGEFQLTIEQLRHAGLGALFEAFEQLKSRLRQEGLFDHQHKQTIPPYPRQIGIITSLSTAALQDVLTTLRKRYLSTPIIIYPTAVQGKEAATTIVTSLQTAVQRNECDLLILCRGGGSIEDLWAFNEEIVARAIAACPIPIITGIGHETDFTIADFVADVRAPTPTGAAQLAVPDRQGILHYLESWQHRLQQAVERRIEQRMQSIDLLTHRLIHPGERIRFQSNHLSQLYHRLQHAWNKQLEIYQWQIENFKQRLQSTKPSIGMEESYLQELTIHLQRAMTYRLENLQNQLIQLQQHLIHLDPKAVLARGYSIAYTDRGKVLQDSQQIHTGDNVRIILAKGSATANITKINK
jgi:exodeoxyribonuclease VII large subunit